MKRAWLAVRLVLALLLIAAGAAYANSVAFAQQEHGGFIYEKGENGIIITGYTGTETNIKIPSSIEKMTVTEIGEYAFYRSQVKNVTLPNTVISIGECAFYRADELESINIPKNLTSIETGVFSECRSLKEITVPQNVSFIDNGVFGGCESLKQIKVNSKNAFYKDVDGVLYTKDGKSLVCYPGGRENETYVVLKNTQMIMPFAFYMSNVKNVEIPQTVNEIGDSAFLKSGSLESVNVPDAVKSIDETTFACCRNLKILDISPNITITR